MAVHAPVHELSSNQGKVEQLGGGLAAWGLSPQPKMPQTPHTSLCVQRKSPSVEDEGEESGVLHHPWDQQQELSLQLQGRVPGSLVGRMDAETLEHPAESPGGLQTALPQPCLTTSCESLSLASCLAQK